LITGEKKDKNITGLIARKFEIALFKKFRGSGEEEARLGWRNVDRGAHKIGWRPYILNQSWLTRQEKLRKFAKQVGAKKLNFYLLHSYQWKM